MVQVSYWLTLSGYLLFTALGLFYLGIRWQKLYQKMSPQFLVFVVYLLNFFTLIYGFGVPFYLHILVNVALISCVYFGSQFQVIGLTGGIATGKSTVAKILGEQGFTVLDADQLYRDVRISL